MVILIIISKIVSLLVPILISVAYLTLLERKVMGGIQRRRGPVYVGVLGLLQPFADGMKLFLKENFIPIKANRYLFMLAPILFLGIALGNWALVPLSEKVVIADVHLGILYVLSLSSLSVYGLIIGGWASNSQYSFLGSLRSAAQMISYEIAIALILFTVVIYAGSLNLSVIVLSQKEVWFIWPLVPIFIMLFVCALAETSRPPFDLPEAEAELVSGYNVEYSSMGFAFFFIAEYMNIIFMSGICSILFMGGWMPPINWLMLNIIPSIVWMSVKIIIVVFIFIWVRASFPRFRFDQLMMLTWRVFLPLSLSWFFFVMASSMVEEDMVYLSIGLFYSNFKNKAKAFVDMEEMQKIVKLYLKVVKTGGRWDPTIFDISEEELAERLHRHYYNNNHIYSSFENIKDLLTERDFFFIDKMVKDVGLFTICCKKTKIEYERYLVGHEKYIEFKKKSSVHNESFLLNLYEWLDLIDRREESPYVNDEYITRYLKKNSGRFRLKYSHRKIFLGLRRKKKKK